MSDLVDIENLRREVLAFTSPPPPFLIQQLSIAAAALRTSQNKLEYRDTLLRIAALYPIFSRQLKQEESLCITMIDLPTEVLHHIAFGVGVLGAEDVGSLARTCRRMTNVLIKDVYAANVHKAMRGALVCATEKEWRQVRYAVNRGWVGDEDEAAEAFLILIDLDGEENTHERQKAVRAFESLVKRSRPHRLSTPSGIDESGERTYPYFPTLRSLFSI